MSTPHDDAVPEADALEQEAEVDAAGEILEPTHDPEVPEADAWEQAQELPEDEDESTVAD